jgi:hypothetical protein
MVCRLRIQFRTLGGENASFDLKVIAKCAPDEVDSIVVA